MEKFEKVLNSEKVDSHNLFETISSHINLQLRWSNLFSSPKKPGICISHLYFYFLDIMIYLYIKKACLHNLCMNHTLLDRESLDRAS